MQEPASASGVGIVGVIGDEALRALGSQRNRLRALGSQSISLAPPEVAAGREAFTAFSMLPGFGFGMGLGFGCGCVLGSG